MLNGFTRKLFLPADNSPLILFRIFFGLLLFYHCLSFMLSGKLDENFIHPPFTFTYIGFEFLQPLPGNGMYWYFSLMCLFALMIMTGTFYRIAMPGFAIMWTLVYLSQKSNYNNHYYLMVIFCWLMCMMPANRDVSIDAKRNSSLKTDQCPRWVNLVFIAQTAIVYFYAGISKINADWLSGKFISIQFSRLSHHHWFGDIYGNKVFQQFICYSGLFFDLLIVPLLLWKRTRYFAFAAFCMFHLFNSYSFRIGIFPYLSIATAVFFLDNRITNQLIFRKNIPPLPQNETAVHSSPGLRKALLVLLCMHFILQLLLPLRSLLYPGNVFWTEEGYRMSWKMMLRAKYGWLHFKIEDKASGKKWSVHPSDHFNKYHVSWIAICPDITWQYAQRIKKEFRQKGYPGVNVYAIDSVVLNNASPRLLIDTTVDLAKVKWEPFRHSKWILPFNKN